MSSAPGFSSARSLVMLPGMLQKGCQRGGYQPCIQVFAASPLPGEIWIIPGIVAAVSLCREGTLEVPVGAGPCGAADFSVLEPTLPSR